MAKISINLKDGSVAKEQEQEIILGIDLGTTNSLVAYIKDGDPVTIKSPGGKSSLVPSIIHFGNEGNLIIGDDAKDLLIRFPEKTIYSVKRL